MVGILAAGWVLLAPARASAQALCPAGARPEGNACVKDAASAWAAPAAPAEPPPAEPPDTGRCAAFNARLAAFQRRYVAAYSGEGSRHKDLEESLRREADQDRRLAASLQRQAFRARQAEVRFELRDQARAAAQAAAGAQARLAAAVRTDREEEERFKDLYKVQAETLLAGRPEGCAVRVPAR